MSMSVIVPAFNAARTVEACLRAVREAAPGADVIVVDDASTDGTASIAAVFADHVVVQPANAGPAAARRIGAERARGELIAFVDADVLVRADTFRRIEAFFRENPSVDAVTGRLAVEHPNGDFWSQYKNLYMNYIFLHTPDDASFIYGSLFAIRSRIKSFLPDHGRKGEDTALGQTLVRAGRSVRLLKDLEVVHLKGYSLVSFIKNDFTIPYSWGRLLTRGGGWRLFGRKGAGFAHASKSQLASVMIAPLALASFVLFWPAGVALVAAWVALNARFIAFLIAHRGGLFGAAALPATFMDHLVMAAGAGCGCCFGWWGADR